MRIPYLLFILMAGFLVTTRLHGQDPGAQQDAEAAREKLLKAADELENIQANSETEKASVEGLKDTVAKVQSDVAALQSDNASLRQEVADLRAALEKSEAARVKEQKALVDAVAGMIAKGSAPTKAAGKKKAKDVAPKSTAPEPAKPTDDSSPSPAPAVGAATPPPADSPPPSTNSSPETPAAAETAAPIKTQKGYYHIVAGGETLTLIASAYRQVGVHVSVAEIKKANGLTDKSILMVGEKLFIPKPGT